MRSDDVLKGAMVLGQTCHWSLSEVLALPTSDFLKCLDSLPKE
ncbi:hypothetical protein PT277_01490 [Acetobacteraceae bacterium ESL0709]|nr:hypothetical protein [Acetobacteraceae bacterium ESL0709]